jgi:hypothetical protein
VIGIANLTNRLITAAGQHAGQAQRDLPVTSCYRDEHPPKPSAAATDE